jgi:ABC-type multidrug transport system permease subunit
MTTNLETSPALLPSNPVREGWILTRRALQHWVRQPARVIFNLAFSIMLLLMFGLLFAGSITVPGGGDYIDFLLPGMFAITMLFGLEGTMTAITEDSKRGITDRFRSLRIHSASVSLGRAGADLLSTVLDLAVLMIGGLVLGWSIGTNPASAVLAVLLLLWLRFAFLWLGIFLGLIFRGTGATTAVQVLVWPVGFLSAALVAPETMPAWLRPIAEWNPVSATATAARELFGNPTGVTSGILADNAAMLATVWPLAITLVFLPLSAFAYRRLGS